jgi:hypothetical protein
MDQRQLLTFSLSRLRLVPEYEKKRMMDGASGNISYDDFYRDRWQAILAHHQ